MKERGAAGLDGPRPAWGAASAAWVGTVACGAPPAAPRGWRQPLATTTPPAPSQGKQRPTRVVVPPRRAPSPRWPTPGPRRSGSAAPARQALRGPAPPRSPANGSGCAKRGRPPQRCGGSANARSAPSRRPGRISATPRCVRRYACACGSVACGGPSTRASRTRPRRGGWPTRKAGRSQAGPLTGSRVWWRLAFCGTCPAGWRKKSPSAYARASPEAMSSRVASQRRAGG